MEQKIFKEANFAITTHRIIWGDDGVFQFDNLSKAFVMKDDWWKSTATWAVIGVILVAIGATWSIIVGLLCFLGGFYMWKSRSDTLFLVTRSNEDIKLKIPNSHPGLTEKVRSALYKREEIVAGENQEIRSDSARSALDEVDNL